MGDPTVSLLPQPATPAPIQAMHGGGMGGGAENVSLLPQPAVPAPIQAMHGGGPENVSLLPQPAVPAPVEPVRGGGASVQQVGGATIPTFTLKALKQVQIVPEEPTLLTVDLLNAYREKRKGIWGTPPSNYEESRTKQFHYEIKTKEPVKIFYIYSWDNFLRFVKTIANDKIKKKNFIYIFFSKLDNITLFSLIFKKYIRLVTETPADVFFLYDRTGPKNQIVWDSKHREDKAEKKFLFLEPASISIPYVKEGKNYNLVLSSTGVPPSEVPKDYIGLTSRDMPGGDLLKFEEKDGEYKPKSLFKLTPDTFYGVDTPKTAVNAKEYLRRKYVLFSFEDTEEEETEVEEATEPVAAAVVPTEPVAAAAPEPVAAPPPLKPDPYVLKLKGTVAVRIGVNVFELRKPTLAVQKEWDEGTFSDSEKAFFADIGLTDKFIESAKGPAPLSELQTRKESLLKKRGEVLTRLVLNRCFKEPNLLLTQECQSVREFLQELYELIQIDRVNLFRKTFAGIAPAIVSLQKQKIGQIIFTQKEILSLLDGLLPISKMPKGSDMFDIKFLRTVGDLVGPGSATPPAGPGAPPGGLAAIIKPGVGSVPTALNPIGISALYSI